MKKPIIKISELQQISDAILIDARGGADAFARYMEGHLPNALFLDLESQLSKKASDAKNGGRHPLPSPEEFGNLLGSLGIDKNSAVVVYDDKSGANAAARFWWMMKAAGHEKVYVIDGGLNSILKAGIALSKTVEKPQRSGSYKITNWQRPTSLMSELDNSNKLIIDVREAYRYNGESEPIDLIAGHIPGAINAPYIENLNEEGEFLPANDLKIKYEKILAGKSVGETIIHCGSGVTACHTLLAMEQAGLTGASLYVGSWSEWSRNDKPMITQTTS